MELICPHCQQRIQIADAMAGQTTSCPKCSGPFTAPMLPPSAALRHSAAAPTSAAADPPAAAPVDSGLETLAAPAAAAIGSEPAAAAAVAAGGGLAPRRAVVLQQDVVRWIAPACLILNFFLLFFPWVGVYPGGAMFARQSGAGIAFGLSPTRADEKLLEKIAAPSADALLILYFLLMLMALLLVGVLIAWTYGPPDLKRKLGDHVTKLLPWRSMAITVVSALAFLFVELHHIGLVNFPIENLAAGNAASVLKDAEEGASAQKASAADILFIPFMYRTAWFSWVVMLNWLALLSALADMWLERRGKRPPPCLLLEW